MYPMRGQNTKNFNEGVKKITRFPSRRGGAFSSQHDNTGGENIYHVQREQIRFRKSGGRWVGKTKKDLLSLIGRNCKYLTAAISLPEAHVTVLAGKNGRSPESDGIPVEFYKSFWDMIGQDMVALFNAVLQRRHLTPANQRLTSSCYQNVNIPKNGRLLTNNCCVLTTKC